MPTPSCHFDRAHPPIVYRRRPALSPGPGFSRLLYNIGAEPVNVCTRFPRKVPDFLRYTALLRLPVGFLLIKMPDFRAARGLGHPGRRLYRKGRESFMQKVSVCSMAKRTRRVLWMGIPAGCRLLAAAIPLYLWQGEDEALESRHLDGGETGNAPCHVKWQGAFRKKRQGQSCRGRACQMLSAYSAMARSEAKTPLQAVFVNAMAAHLSRSR